MAGTLGGNRLTPAVASPCKTRRSNIVGPMSCTSVKANEVAAMIICEMKSARGSPSLFATRPSHGTMSTQVNPKMPMTAPTFPGVAA